MKNRILFVSLAIILALGMGLIGCGGEGVPEITEYNLTISSTEGGLVTTPGEGTFTYDEGEVVGLVAEHDEGYEFVNWTGDVSTVGNVNAASTTVAINDNYEITANFEAAQSIRYSLTISSTTGGSTINPGEGTFIYDAGTVVSLIAEAEEGYQFVEWTGDIDSIADMEDATTTLTMNDDYVIIANFELPTYESLDYFPIAEGYGIKYHVTDNSDDTPCNVNVWAVSQYYETGKPDDLDFVFTLIKEGAGGQYYCPCSLGGQTSRTWNNKHFTAFYAGFPVGNQGNFYWKFCVLRTFSSGDEWTWGDRQYMVEQIGQQTINGVDFDDCIKITINDSLHEYEYLRGSGYFILARDIGIVKLVFDRTDGTRVSYEYIEHRELVRHTISGTIRDRGVPVEGIVVGISNGSWGIRSVTDPNGAFSIQAYGPDIVLRLGYDEDNDDVLDFDDYPNYPKEYSVNDITSDIVNLNIDISTL